MWRSVTRAIAFQQLLADSTYYIEYGGFLTNHVKHGLIALERLEAPPERVQEFWKMYTTLTQYNLTLEPIPVSWEDVVPINASSWEELRGKKENWQGTYAFLRKELSDEYVYDARELVKQYAPDVLAGMAGALTHTIIHLGWALDAYDEHNPAMVIEGLAYMNYAYISCEPQNFNSSAVNETGPVESLVRIATTWRDEDLGNTWIEPTKEKYNETSGFHPELIPADFQWQLSKVLANQHEVAYKLPSWLDTMSISEVELELYKTTALLYLITLDGEGNGDFFLLHLISSLWGLEQVLNVIDDDDIKREAYKCYWVVLICIVATTDNGFPPPESIEEAAIEFDKTDENVEELKDIFWPATVERAYPEKEEHNIKLVYVTRELWNRYNYWAGFSAVPQHFTLTPELDLSFNE